jgi:hypothetical protein
MTAPGTGNRNRRDNGLSADSFLPVADVDTNLAPVLLDALGRARIAAYVESGGATLDRMFVAADDRGDARTIIAAASRAAGSGTPIPVPETLGGRDTDAEFRALVGDWHVDTVAAIRSAEKDLAREDADWRARIDAQPPESADTDDEHYIPPPPPPLPRLSGLTIWAMVILALSIVVLGFGDEFGLDGNLTILLGIGGLLVSAGMLVMRLREHPRDEDDDDGAML